MTSLGYIFLKVPLQVSSEIVTTCIKEKKTFDVIAVLKNVTSWPAMTSLLH